MIAEAAVVGRDSVASGEARTDRMLPGEVVGVADEREGCVDSGQATDARPTTEEIEQLKPRRVPSSRNREIYRQVKILERSERDVARQYGLTQPRIFAICKQVRLWTEETAGGRPDQSPEAKHNLAVGNARLRLSHTFSQAAKWLEVTGQPSQTERIKAGDQTGDVVKKSPSPNPHFSLRRRNGRPS